MIASVQYNDIVGTAAADIADMYFNSLQKFLIDSYSSYDGERFSCRGCSMFLGSRNSAYVSFVCLDKKTSEFVRFITPEPLSIEQFFNIFKRFEIVIGKDMDEINIPDGNERRYLTNDKES